MWYSRPRTHRDKRFTSERLSQRRSAIRAAVGFSLLYVFTTAAVAYAEKGVLILNVKDTKDQPIGEVKISTEGDGSTGPPTDKAGKTRIRLAPQTQPGHRVTLQIVGSPAQRDLVFISPWDRTAQVPPFENES